MDFKAFDTAKLDEYAKRAKEQWGSTAEYKEFEKKDKKRSDEDNAGLAAKTMEYFTEFGAMRDREPSDPEVQAQVKRCGRRVHREHRQSRRRGHGRVREPRNRDLL